jgi:CBS domain-containing protein
MPDGAAPFMVVGMIACFGSVAHAPLGLMLMVAEMTGSLALLPPAIVAIGLATLVVGDDTIYESQLRSRVDAPAHRAAFGLPLLSSVLVADVMTDPRLVLVGDADGTQARGRLTEAHVPGAPVVASDGTFIGVLSSDADTPDTPDSDATAAAVADRSYPTVAPDLGLDMAMDAMVSAGTTWLPVVDGGRVRGIVGMNEVISGYQGALRRSLGRLATVSDHSVLVEAAIEERSPFAGTTVADAPWPKGGVALSIDRHSHLIVPRAETALQAGDVVAAVVPADAEPELRRRFNGQRQGK